MDWVLTSRQGHTYGFKKNCYSFVGLATELSMDKASPGFKQIENNCRELQQEHLDIGYAPMGQTANIRAIGSELMKRHPGIFGGMNGRKPLYYALRIIEKLHHRERHSKKQKPKKKKKGKKEEDLEEASSMSSNSSNKVNENSISVSSRIIKDSGDQRSVNKPMRLAGDVSSKSHRRGEPYPLRSKHSRGMAPRSVSSDGIVEIIDLTDIPHSPVKEDDSVPPKLEVPSNATTECPSTAEAAKQEDVYAFLDTCQPPMLQYTQQFMDFGCTSNKYLRAVSLWRKEQRYNLVRKIMQSSHATESEPTEMDIAILVNQFETYFLEN